MRRIEPHRADLRPEGPVRLHHHRVPLPVVVLDLALRVVHLPVVPQPFHHHLGSCGHDVRPMRVRVLLLPEPGVEVEGPRSAVEVLEELLEDLEGVSAASRGERVRVAAAAAAAARDVGVRVAAGIVDLALAGVGQHLVRRAQVLELLLRVRGVVRVLVRVPAHSSRGVRRQCSGGRAEQQSGGTRHFRAPFRYAFLMAFSSASLGTPSTL